MIWLNRQSHHIGVILCGGTQIQGCPYMGRPLNRASPIYRLSPIWGGGSLRRGASIAGCSYIGYAYIGGFSYRWFLVYGAPLYRGTSCTGDPLHREVALYTCTTIYGIGSLLWRGTPYTPVLVYRDILYRGVPIYGYSI